MTQHTDVYEDFVRLLSRHQKQVYSYLLTLLTNPADAEEVLQETSITLWRKFGDFDPQSDFRAWALSVAYWEVQAFRKKRSRDRLVFSDQLLEHLSRDVDKFSKSLDLRRQALADCILNLSARDRSLLVCRYRPGSTTASVASEVGRSVAAIYKALNRIHTALLECARRVLREQGELS
jgi:RNA polymerase sigma-70 factor (ECF subfamily)